jgi:hypothetical protein
MPRTRGQNRVGLGMVGLILLAGGGFGIARHYGKFGTAAQHDPILLSDVRNFAANNRDWFWWAAGVASVVVALLALGWLRDQLRLPLPANDHLDRLEVDGRTRLDGAAAADALAAEVDALPGVASADARVWGDPTRPDVYLRVHIHDDVAVDVLRSDIETARLDRLRHALQVEHVDASVDLMLDGPQGRVVE